MGRGLFIAVVLMLGLAGCGPRTIVSSIFPLKYAAKTNVAFEDDGRQVVQTIVSHCKIIDQTDSIATGYHVDTEGERHWIARRDGSIWLIGSLSPCRWRDRSPDPHGPMRPMTPDATYHDQKDDPPAWRLHDRGVLRIDSADRPVRMDVYDGAVLFGPGVDGLRAHAWLGPGEGPVTDSLRRAWPWLAGLEATAAARRKAARADYDAKRVGPPEPTLFAGWSAKVTRFENGLTCEAPAGRGLVALTESPACRYERECRDDVAAAQPCRRDLGGLRPVFEDDYRTARFGDPAAAEPTYRAGLIRVEALRQAGAQAPNTIYDDGWDVRVCIETTCAKPERLRGVMFYDGERRLLVEVHRTNEIVASVASD